MSKETIIKCDVCGKDISNYSVYNEVITINNIGVSFSVIGDGIPELKQNKHMCSGCFIRIFKLES